MFRQCAGDAAPGSSQTAFGSGSFLLAPLSNFRAGTLPTTVSLPHSHKPETDSLPACLAAHSPSHSLSPFLPLSAFVSLSLFYSHSLFLPAVTNSLFLWLLVSHSQSLPLRLSSVSLWFRAFRIKGLQSHSQHLNHVVHCRCLSSVLSLLSLSSSLSLHLSSTYCGLTCWL